MNQPHQEPLLDIARGDAARSHQLRASLKTLRDRTENPEFRKLLDDVLSGKQGLRDAARNPLFGQAMAPGVHQAVGRLKQMSDEEKARLAEVGEQQLNHLRDRLAAEKSTRPRRSEGGARPAVEDEDFGGNSVLRDDSW